MAHVISLALVLYGFWLLLSGHGNILLLSLGAASVALVLWLSWRMDVVDHESQPLHLSHRLPGYWLWLLLEVIKSNIDVARRIWSPSLPISPTTVYLKANQKTALGKAIYANSITLTPGTVTINLQGDKLEVHALTREAAADLQSGDMDRRVQALED